MGKPPKRAQSSSPRVALPLPSDSDDDPSDSYSEPPAAAAGVASGKDHREKVNARKRQLSKEDKIPQIRKGKKNTPWTLVLAVVLCAVWAKNGDQPYPADSEKQIASWLEQEAQGIQPAKRKILMKCASGVDKPSPTITYMQSQGKTPEVAAKCKLEGNKAKRCAHMGQDQKNAVEGVAIHLLLDFLCVVPSFCDWEAFPVFDGLEADFIMRKKDWPPDEFVPVQMKSVGECIDGKTVNYSLKKCDYPNVFCVGVGLQGYVLRTVDVIGPDDIANAPGCAIVEIWNIGSCGIIEASLNPTFGVRYSKLDAARRLQCATASAEEKRAFATTLLGDIEAWPRMDQRRIFYEFSHEINSKVTQTCQTEKAGFVAVDKVLRLHGMCVEPVWRQGECVDYKVLATGKPLAFVSAKTGSLKNGKDTQRGFELHAAPNSRFCDFVVASYAGKHHKVALMSRDTVYAAGMKTFSWNEERLKEGVRVFEDIRIPDVGKAFAECLASFAPV
jgi:hypothetical protein